MGIFQTLDFERLGSLVRGAQSRVLLCIPGFDDAVGTAVIDACRRLGSDSVVVIADASDRAARMGYGYFDAVKEVHEAGVAVRIEPGLRLGVVIIDDSGWCFSVPAQLVDATMEKAQAPNAVQLAAAQVNAIASALKVGAKPSTHDLVNGRKGEIGNKSLTSELVKQIGASLDQNPPQKFDIARKINVFNAYVEFVELEVSGIEIKKFKVTLPSNLLQLVTDPVTREKISTSFRLIDASAEIHQLASVLRTRANEIRKIHTRNLPGFGAVVLRGAEKRKQLEDEFHSYKLELEKFALKVEQEIGAELERSRAGLIQALLPGFRRSPPASLKAEIIGSVTDVILEAWLRRRLDSIFPTPESLRVRVKAELVFKGVTYGTLTNSDFQSAVRVAYPQVDFDKPFEEFTAAKESE